MRQTVFNLFFVSLCTPYSWAQQPEWKTKYKDPKVLRTMFEEPPLFYAPHVFWFWDDTIRHTDFPATMALEMTRQRMNPGYVHPRSSMNRMDKRLPSLPYEQYLEKPYFESFRKALHAASNAGFSLGYCDDYDWPSGQAAGRVLEQRPDLEAQHLEWKRIVVETGELLQLDSVDFVLAAKLKEGQLDASTLRLLGERKVKWTAPKGQWVVYTYTKKFHAGADGGRVNYLHPDLMKTFIPIVHEQYERAFAEHMGTSIPGVFVDHEGDYGWHIAWSDYLAQLFMEKKKRDIRLWLPLLTEKDRDGLYAKARNDWFEVVSEAYLNCFFKPMVTWLDKRDMYAISNLWEESLQAQTSMVGDLMEITRAVSMPGNDCLVMKSQKVHDFKEVQSVAEFEDRPFMSEIMGVAGWEQTPQMMKQTVNAITSFGVSHVVPHGINLNRKLETIPFPADWYTENPFWPHLHYWNDFTRRASFVVRQTQLVADVLLFHPLESIRAEAEGMFYHREDGILADSPEVWNALSRSINTTYAEAMECLNTSNIEFLIGDKHYLDRATCANADGKTILDIQSHQFKVLVLPPVSILSQATSRKILAFAQAGGTVVLLGRLATGSPEVGQTDPQIIKDMQQLRRFPHVVDLADGTNNPADLADVVRERIGSRIAVPNAGRLYTTHRKLDSTHYYWLANNTDSVKRFDAWFRDGEGAAEIWNCENGGTAPVCYANENGWKKMKLTLQPYEGYWLVFNPDKEPLTTIEKDVEYKKVEPINGLWTISYPDVDTIYRTSGTAWHALDPIESIEKIKALSRDSAGFRSSFIHGSLERIVEKDGQSTRVPYELSAGKASCWHLTIPLGARSIIFPKEMLGMHVWIDHKELIVPESLVSLVKSAKTLSIEQANQLPRTPIAFEVGRTTGNTLNSWYGYGLDQYTGYLDYETTIHVTNKQQKITLKLGKVDYLAEVFVNGTSVGGRLWPPFEFNLSAALKKGKNTITIRTGNLMVNQMALADDMHRLRTWSWGFSPEPNLDQYDSGLLGPVVLERYD